LPEPRTRLQGATTIKGKLYVAGGASFNNGDSVKTTLFVYDPTTDTWSRRADTPFWPCGGVQANISGKLYVYNSCDYGDFFVYDPRTDKWRALPKMQWTDAPFGSPVGDAINGKFYLTGGTDGYNRSNLLHVYDPATGTWTRKRSMPTGREGAYAAEFHGKLFVAGGLVRSSTGTLSVTNKVEAYDPVTDTWAEGPPLPTPRAFGGSAWAGGRFYTVGGIVDGLNDASSKVEAMSTSY
jgi:N-acetylneuraminic acid mutarotase